MGVSMEFKWRTLAQIANMICGNRPEADAFFPYRSGSELTFFFQDIRTDYVFDGSTRWEWVAKTLETILAEPQPAANVPSGTFTRVIEHLMDRNEARNEGPGRPGALALLNKSLAREGYEAFYGPDGRCRLRYLATDTVAAPGPNPHRPFSTAERERRERLAAYLDTASEDQLIENVLLPLFRQLGFHRITSAGHKDKALEYGKDAWMRFTLPTQHRLYFGIQAKRGKLDAAGMSRAGNVNIAEVYQQALMMLGHEIFDPEIGKQVLVDHAYIVAAGEITKAARGWIGNKLDDVKRSQIMFLEREDILNLFVTADLPAPEER
jgi:hypothetical protein